MVSSDREHNDTKDGKLEAVTLVWVLQPALLSLCISNSRICASKALGNKGKRIRLLSVHFLRSHLPEMADNTSRIETKPRREELSNEYFVVKH